MSNRIVGILGTGCLVLLLPAISHGQNKKCGTSSSSTTASRTPKTSSTPNMTTSRFSAPNMPVTSRSSNTPKGLRPGPQQHNPLGGQQNPQLQAGILQHQQFQQGMLQEVSNQYLLQTQVKQQLLIYAFEAPSENLRRELTNSNAFVRWAASVELNRRWKIETAIAREKPAPVVVVAAAPRHERTATPAVVTRVNQAILLQFGVPKSE